MSTSFLSVSLCVLAASVPRTYRRNGQERWMRASELNVVVTIDIKQLTSVATVFVALVLLSNVNAAGQVDPWEFEVLPYTTEQRGAIELETNDAVIVNGHSGGGNGTAAGSFRSQRMWYNADELTYGLTDRI